MGALQFPLVLLSQVFSCSCADTVGSNLLLFFKIQLSLKCK